MNWLEDIVSENRYIISQIRVDERAQEDYPYLYKLTQDDRCMEILQAIYEMAKEAKKTYGTLLKISAKDVRKKIAANYKITARQVKNGLNWLSLAGIIDYMDRDRGTDDPKRREFYRVNDLFQELQKIENRLEVLYSFPIRWEKATLAAIKEGNYHLIDRWDAIVTPYALLFPSIKGGITVKEAQKKTIEHISCLYREDGYCPIPGSLKHFGKEVLKIQAGHKRDLNNIEIIYRQSITDTGKYITYSPSLHERTFRHIAKDTQVYIKKKDKCLPNKPRKPDVRTMKKRLQANYPEVPEFFQIFTRDKDSFLYIWRRNVRPRYFIDREGRLYNGRTGTMLRGSSEHIKGEETGAIFYKTTLYRYSSSDVTIMSYKIYFAVFGDYTMVSEKALQGLQIKDREAYQRLHVHHISHNRGKVDINDLVLLTQEEHNKHHKNGLPLSTFLADKRYKNIRGH